MPIRLFAQKSRLNANPKSHLKMTQKNILSPMLWVAAEK